ncbi:MAG: SUF system Fe-S cluster assembly protein [Deltaproteobacteria bacterium]|nr:SUF system Fe-S cluster assembly protein [Deltaproteobacteria bacterium]MBW2398946.1 SUF system Fe-S cluster assembly protein [Deltaproteobacteria bacterium]MBW2667112.1 SUF system Fe-S cluster assembly protein [Deltaproteobacteria bacterium]
MSEVSAEAQIPVDSADPEQIRERVIATLRTIYDPEIPVNIFELGLIYDVAIAEGGEARIRMTLTTPMCPVAEELPIEVESKARTVDGVMSARVDLVWDPPWTMEMMSEAAKLELGML